MNLCSIFGHKQPKGYAGGLAYGEPRGGYKDGIGREHWSVWVRCDRCDTRFPVVNFHGPIGKTS